MTVIALVEVYSCPMALLSLHSLEETGYQLLNVPPLYFSVIAGLLHEEPGKSRSVVLQVALQIGNTVDGGGSQPGLLEMGYEDELIIEIPAEFAELQHEREDEAILVLAEDESQVLVDVFEAVLEEGGEDVIMHLGVHSRHDVVDSQFQHFCT